MPSHRGGFHGKGSGSADRLPVVAPRFRREPPARFVGLKVVLQPQTFRAIGRLRSILRMLAANEHRHFSRLCNQASVISVTGRCAAT